MARVFVAGGSGFIGSPFLRHAVAAGHEVLTLVRSGASRDAVKALGAEAIEGDLKVKGAWQGVARTAELVVHLAQPQTFGGRVTRKRAETWRDDRLSMDRNLLDGLDLSVTKRVLYVAGTSYYGDQGTQLRDETAAPNPRGFGPYLVDALQELRGRMDRGLPVVTCFPGYIYGSSSWFAEYIVGPLGKGKKANQLTGPSRWGTMMHADDCARALLHLLGVGQVGERYFVVDDRPVLWTELYEVTARALGVPLRMRISPAWLAKLILGSLSTEGLQCDARLSNAKLKATGFSCRFPSIESGIPDVVNAMRASK